MRKTRICALALALCLMLPLVPAASAASADTVEQTVRAMGIITGDNHGNMNLDAAVTRAQFAKMMVAASTLKDSVGSSSGVSPFSDVKHYHWAAEYVKNAVAAGWLIGYVDGTFKPEAGIRLEEGAAAVLRMLGYTDADLVGTWPSAQLSKYRALGLDEGIACAQGQAMTRRDCMYLFYNLMTATGKAGVPYAQSLGYTLTVSGEVDYNSLVSRGLKGPYIAGGESLSAMVPFSLQGAEIYRSGGLAAAGDLKALDVVYYHENLRTVWIYTDRAVGLYSAALPSGDAPSQVVVGGTTYAIGTASAAYKLSTMGAYRPGDTVTLLLGRSGEVVEVLDGSEGSGVWHGVVTAKSVDSYVNASGIKQEVDTLTVLCTDGVSRQFSRESGSFNPGSVVTVTVDKGETAISRVTFKAVSGTVNSAGTRLGDTPISASVGILDADRDGNAAPVYPSRLAGRKLNAADIRFCALNSAGEISHLILNDATGDIATYGVITSVQEVDLSSLGGAEDGGQSGEDDGSAPGGLDLGSLSGTQVGIYQYVIHGTSGTYTADKLMGFKTGPVAITLAGSGISAAEPLKEHTLTELSSSYAMAGGTQLTLSQGVQVYLVSGGSYTLSSASEVGNLDRYTLKGYTDTGHSLGGQIRIILAEKK